MVKELGYITMPEQATLAIKEGQLLPWVNRDLFQQEVLRRQLEAESGIADESAPMFLDRGVYDGEAYYIYDKIEIPAIFK